MTDDEILAEVDKAFLTCESLPVSQLDNKYFIAFARAIAAAEREACATECEKWGHRKWEDYEESGNSYVEGQADCAFGLADAIRARSET